MKVLLMISDAYLVGLAVVVALVVYPAFRLVGLDEWSEYHQQHSRGISIAVGPMWLLQGIASAWWILAGPSRALGLIHGALAFAGVVATVFGAVPQHNAITKGRTLARLQRLSLWHWVRTFLWVAALLCVIAL